jgi:hypothetical protein
VRNRKKGTDVKLELTEEQAEELKALLEGALREMSHEIAATDNPEYRSALNGRRQILTAVADALQHPAETSSHGADALTRELSHPGD